MSTIARRVMHRALSGVTGGTLHIVDSSGARRFGRPPGNRSEIPIDASVTVHDDRVYARVLREGSVGLGESFADGWWDCDDLAGVLRLAHRSLQRTHQVRDRAHRLARPVVDPIASLRSADKERDRRNVRAHYDLGDDLFRHVLDETMMYSCAWFESPDDSLEAASLAKIDRIAEMLELGADDRVLEIGTGWGGFALHVARRFGCHVTTTTTSARQYEFAKRRVRDAGLSHLVDVRSDDYRDLTDTYDKVIAIEMIEAVDWRDYGTFFAQCRRLVSDTGMLAMQAIVIPDESFDRAKRRTDFIKAVIFPGGCVPSVEALSTAAQRHGGFSLLHRSDMGVHYAETLRRWRANLVRSRDQLETLGYDERFIRLWEFYFSYCEAGFDERYTSVVQLGYAAPGWRPRPFGPPARTPRLLASV